MHHRQTDCGRWASVRRGNRAVWALIVAASWLLAPGGPVPRAGAAEEGTGTAKAAAVSADLDRELRQQVRPLLDRFCLKCRSSEEPEADVDLQRFTSIAAARRGVATWRKVADVLDKGEMPPPEARQPSPESRRALRGWVGRY